MVCWDNLLPESRTTCWVAAYPIFWWGLLTGSFTLILLKRVVWMTFVRDTDDTVRLLPTHMLSVIVMSNDRGRVVCNKFTLARGTRAAVETKRLAACLATGCWAENWTSLNILLRRILGGLCNEHNPRYRAFRYSHHEISTIIRYRNSYMNLEFITISTHGPGSYSRRIC